MMKQMILACALTLNLVGCEVSNESKTSSTTVNGMEITEAYKLFISKPAGSCSEGNFKVSWISMDEFSYKPQRDEKGTLNVEVVLKADKTATARVVNQEYSYKVNGDYYEQLVSVDNVQNYNLHWDYSEGEIVLDGFGSFHMINYNGENRIRFVLEENFMKSNYPAVTKLNSFGEFGNLVSFDQNESEVDSVKCEEMANEMGFKH